jgi:MFS family permease
MRNPDDTARGRTLGSDVACGPGGVLRSEVMSARLADLVDRKYRVIVLVASVTMLLVGGGALSTLAVALKPMTAEFGWPRAVPSLAFSMAFIGGGLGGIAMGHVLDRRGMAWPAMIGAVMMGTGTLLVSRVGADWQLYTLFLVMIGIFGQGALAAPLMANVTRWYEHRRGMAVGIVASGQSLAGIVWPPVASLIIDGWGWREAFLVMGAFSLVVNVPLALVVRRPAPGTAGYRVRRADAAAASLDAAALVRAVPLQPQIGQRPWVLEATLCAAIVGCCTAMALPLGHLVAFVSDLGHPAARGAEVLSVMLLATFFTRVAVLGFVTERFGGLRALFAFSVVQATGLALLGLNESLIGFYLIGVIYGVGYGGIFPVYPVIVREYLPAATAGRRTGVIMLFGALGMALGAYMGGFVYDLTGSYGPAFAFGVAFNLANLAIVGALIRQAGPRIARAAAV